MENVILFDNEVREKLLPLTFTRPVGEIRVGILTIREKWERWLNVENISFITQDYLAEKYPIKIASDNFVVNGSALPSDQLCRLITQLGSNEALLRGDELIAARLDERQFKALINDEEIEELSGFDLEDTHFLKIDNLPDIFKINDAAIKEDFKLLTEDRDSQAISSSNQIIGDARQIFLEEGARVECAILNATDGPIYIGKNAEVMEGSLIRGSLALCEGSKLKMGAKIYNGTTIGPYSKAGGEIKNVVMIGYSSKSHDGYMGNSVIGEWCNLGADTNCSNMKNNYSEIKLWDYTEERFLKTGMQFCGLIMGDHSKCGINTMFNCGTVVGVFANVFGEGYPRNFIPSFAWGGTHGFTTYQTQKVFETAKTVMARRDISFEKQDQNILEKVFEDTATFRPWEKEG